MNTRSEEWNVYRTRFLIRAQQLTEPMVFIDFLGREHRGVPGDYLVESSQGSSYVVAHQVFEDIYVVLEPSVHHNNSFFPEKAGTSNPLSEGTPENRPFSFVENRAESSHPSG